MTMLHSVRSLAEAQEASFPSLLELQISSSHFESGITKTTVFGIGCRAAINDKNLFFSIRKDFAE